jgi:hypothetical protein
MYIYMILSDPHTRSANTLQNNNITPTLANIYYKTTSPVYFTKPTFGSPFYSYYTPIPQIFIGVDFCHPRAAILSKERTMTQHKLPRLVEVEKKNLHFPFNCLHNSLFWNRSI